MSRVCVFVVACSVSSGAVDLPGKLTVLYSNCAQSEKIGVLLVSADVKVTSSIAGEEGTCFRITGMAGGKAVEGAIFDPSHPAVTAYYEAVRKPTAPPPPAPAPPPTEAPGVPERASRFANFTATNFHDGERFELAKIRSKIVLIHFWESARDEAAIKDAEFLSHMRAQYGDQGLEVVGVTGESSENRVRTFNENAEAVWPLVRDRKGLAEKYGVTGPSEIFVLDSHRNIISSGARPPDMEAIVSQRLGRR